MRYVKGVECYYGSSLFAPFHIHSCPPPCFPILFHILHKVCAAGIYKKVFTSKQDNESIKQNDDDNGHGASSISRSPVFSLVHYFLNFILSLCLFLLCRYFVLDPELGQLQYFVNEQGKSQKPRGSLPLIGASVTTSDEAPHMFIVNAVNGELYKLRGMSSRWPQAARIRQRTNSERVCVCFTLDSCEVRCRY